MLQIGGCLDLGQEPLGADDGREFRPQHLDGDVTIVVEIAGEVPAEQASSFATAPLQILEDALKGNRRFCLPSGECRQVRGIFGEASPT